MPNQLKDVLERTGHSEIRSNIERIVTSYRHEWDIYIELLQNSADAIIDQFGEDNISSGRISLSISTKERKMVIVDNGIGIRESDLSSILVNGKSLKRDNHTGKYGFMGFGLTFVAFQSDYICIESVKDGVRAKRTYLDLYKVIFDNNEIPQSVEELNSIPTTSTHDINGTTITVSFPSPFPVEALEQNIKMAFEFAGNASVFKAVLRTKSVIGLLTKLFEDRDSFEFELTVDGVLIEVPNGYLSTREIVATVLHGEQSFHDIVGHYESIITATESLSMNQKNQARKAVLLDTKIDGITIGQVDPLEARLYIASTSKNNLNTYNGQINTGLQDPIFEIENGLWLAIGGMPTGVCLDRYDHPNLLPFSAIIDVKDTRISMELDAGRKGITPYRARQVVDTVYELLRDYNFIKYRMYIMGGDTRIGDQLYDPRQELAGKYDEKTMYDVALCNRALPPLEEQEVITLFTEMISTNLIMGYIPKVLSGYQVYDGLYAYGLPKNDLTVYSASNTLGVLDTVFDGHGGQLVKDILIEFKMEFNSIYRDIDRNMKDISHIDLLVCWTVSFENKDRLLHEQGDILKEKDIQTNVFYGATHELISSKRQQPLPIIELKAVLSKLFNIEAT